MNAKSKEALCRRYEAEQARVSAEIVQLEADMREDEANQQKAARNIYGICTQLLGTTDDDATYEQHLAKLENAWRQARELAAAHQDYDRIAMEDAKLSALALAASHYHAVKEDGAT